jgi:hypothetical protein
LTTLQLPPAPWSWICTSGLEPPISTQLQDSRRGGGEGQACQAGTEIEVAMPPWSKGACLLHSARLGKAAVWQARPRP